MVRQGLNIKFPLEKSCLPGFCSVGAKTYTETDRSQCQKNNEPNYLKLKRQDI